MAKDVKHKMKGLTTGGGCLLNELTEDFDGIVTIVGEEDLGSTQFKSECACSVWQRHPTKARITKIKESKCSSRCQHVLPGRMLGVIGFMDVGSLKMKYKYSGSIKPLNTAVELYSRLHHINEWWDGRLDGSVTIRRVRSI